MCAQMSAMSRTQVKLARGVPASAVSSSDRRHAAARHQELSGPFPSTQAPLASRCRTQVALSTGREAWQDPRSVAENGAWELGGARPGFRRSKVSELAPERRAEAELEVGWLTTYFSIGMGLASRSRADALTR
jgi:hypothetical protein